jgi:prevent-host-death family protein
VKASEFKAKCLQVMDEVAATGTPVIITKNGKPVAQLGPVPGKPATLVGRYKHMLGATGDLIAPAEEDWDSGAG